MQTTSSYRVDYRSSKSGKQVDKEAVSLSLTSHGNLGAVAPAQVDPAIQAHIRGRRKNARCRCLCLASPRRLWMRDGVGNRTADHWVGVMSSRVRGARNSII
jgi:hypothetical protein